MPLDSTDTQAAILQTWEAGGDRFIHEQNLAHYRRLLDEASVMDDEVRHK
jgi:hypothetical protein